MKIIQILPCLASGDAIGNDVLTIDNVLKGYGYSCEIMATDIQETLKDRAKEFDVSSITSNDLVLFHKATGDKLTESVAGLLCKKVIIYHNITPAKYFLFYDPVMVWRLILGRKQLRQCVRKMDFAWGDSWYNCEELQKAGAKKVTVRPVFFETDRLEPDQVVIERLKDETGTKILFIGRIAPNKKQEDVIKVYYRYLCSVDQKAKLFLVGSWDGTEKYYAKLKGFCADLGLSDDQVIFTGHVTEEEKEAYLNSADVFLCMSEHEGFCVPLLEAAGHDLPIIAFSAGAVPETLGNSGLLVKTKDYRDIAETIKRVCTDYVLRNTVIKEQRDNLKRFEYDEMRTQFLALVQEATGSLIV